MTEGEKATLDKVDKTEAVLERGLRLNPETMIYEDDFGNEFRMPDGSTIFYGDVLTNILT